MIGLTEGKVYIIFKASFHFCLFSFLLSVEEYQRHFVFFTLLQLHFSLHCLGFPTSRMTTVSGNTVWHQTVIAIEAKKRGIHLITDKISQIPELKKYKIGLANILLQHTSASLSVNESWDPSVRDDMEMMLNRLAPENAPYKHTLEGPDDMPGMLEMLFP